MLLVLAAAGCAAKPVPRRAYDFTALIGHPEADVVAMVGQPLRRLDQGSLRTLVYDRAAADAAAGGLFDAPPPDLPCTLTIILESGRVRSFDERGGGCR